MSVDSLEDGDPVALAACGDAPTNSPGASMIDDDFERYGDQSLKEGNHFGADWDVQYVDGGSVSFPLRESRVCELDTGEPGGSSMSVRSALITYDHAFGDFDLTVREKTVEQKRSDEANVAQVLWNWTGDDHYDYLLLKPNGWELRSVRGTADDADVQLRSGATTFAIGNWYRVHVRQAAGTVTVWAGPDGGDCSMLASAATGDTPQGYIGLNVDNATADFDDVVIFASPTH